MVEGEERCKHSGERMAGRVGMQISRWRDGMGWEGEAATTVKAQPQRLRASSPEVAGDSGE